MKVPGCADAGAHYRAAAHYSGQERRWNMRGMDEPSLPLKQQLPFPYNQDLSQVLQRLDRRTPFSRNRLANDPVTAAYLAAAMRLIEQTLGPDAKRILADPDDDSSISRPLFGFLSQRAVAAEVANNPDPFPKTGNVPTMRSTWKSHSDFIADLLSFALLSHHYPSGHEEEVAAGAEQLIDGPDPVQAVHDLAYGDAAMLAELSTFRLRLVSAAAAEGDDIICNAMSRASQRARAMWMQVYTEFFRARGLQLRNGLTLEEFADILTAVLQGAAFRGLFDSSAAPLDPSRKRSLTGTAALALILGCLERIEEADDRTLEEAVHSMIFDRPMQQGTAE